MFEEPVLVNAPLIVTPVFGGRLKLAEGPTVTSWRAEPLVGVNVPPVTSKLLVTVMGSWLDTVPDVTRLANTIGPART